ncbi:MAG: thioredoxin [Candidatus Berkelbacteria bacterium]|nr:thioredoxin [Candidatus Berkelbacteria bacterium]
MSPEKFEEHINRDKIILVDFHADWCGPCKMMEPIVEEISKEKKVDVLKIDIEENPEIAGKYNVMSIPTFLLFKSGSIVGHLVGAVSKENLDGAIAKALTK